jgi:hypothetical protein
MKLLADEFQAIAVKAFSWLGADLEFEVVDRRIANRAGHPMLSSVTWRNPRLFVQVILEFPRPYLDVQFGPLVHGEVPVVNDLDNRFHLDQLRALVAGETQSGLPKRAELKGLSRQRVSEAVASASREFEVLAWPILKGDDRIFNQLRLDARRRREVLRAKYLST